MFPRLVDYTQALMEAHFGSTGDTMAADDGQEWPGQIVGERRNAKGKPIYLVQWDPDPLTGQTYPEPDALREKDVSLEMLQVWRQQIQQQQSTQADGGPDQTGTRLARAESPRTIQARQLKLKKKSKKQITVGPVKGEKIEQAESEPASKRSKRRVDDLEVVVVPAAKRRRSVSAEDVRPDEYVEHWESKAPVGTDSPEISTSHGDAHIPAQARGPLQGFSKNDGSFVPDSQPGNENVANASSSLDRGLEKSDQDLSLSHREARVYSPPQPVTTDGRPLRPVTVPEVNAFRQPDWPGGRDANRLRRTDAVEMSPSVLSSSPIETSSQMPTQSDKSLPPPPIQRNIPASRPVNQGHWAKSQPFAFRDRDQSSRAGSPSGYAETSSRSLSVAGSQQTPACAQEADQAGVDGISHPRKAKVLGDPDSMPSLEALQTRCDALEAELAYSEAQLQNSKSTIASAKRAVEDAEMKIAALQASLVTANERAEALQLEKQDVQQQCEAAESDRLIWMQHYRAASATAEERNLSNNRLQAENGQLRRSLDVGVKQIELHASAALHTAKAQAKVSAAQLRFIQEQAAPLQQHLHDQTQLTQRFKTAFDALQYEHAALRRKYEILEANADPSPTRLTVAAQRAPATLSLPSEYIDEDEDEDPGFETETEEDEGTSSLEENIDAEDQTTLSTSDTAVWYCAWRMEEALCQHECEDQSTLISHLLSKHVFQ